MSDANAGRATGSGNLGVLPTILFSVPTQTIPQQVNTLLNQFATVDEVGFTKISPGYLYTFAVNITVTLATTGGYNFVQWVKSPSGTFNFDVTVLQTAPVGFESTTNDDFNFTGTFISEPDMYYAVAIIASSGFGQYQITAPRESFLSQLALVA